MANDTAALVVALSAQVSKFQKDMDQANGIADKSVKKIEDRFAAANGAIGKQLGNFASTATSQLGAAGSVLTALGPIGLTVAASLGALALAFSFVSDKVDDFAEKSKKLKESAETAGLTITQFRLLSAAGKKVGLDTEETEGFITKLTVSFDELRTGSGKLFDQLARIDVGLVREVASSKNTAEAIDILARAYANLTDQAQRNALARAIGGRSGVAGGRLLESVADQGGIEGLQKAAEDAGKKIDEALLTRIATLKREIDEVKRRTANIWGETFSIEVLEQQKRSAEFWERIAIAAAKAKAFATAPESTQPQATRFARRFRGADQPFVAGAEPGADMSEPLAALGRSRLSGGAGQAGVPLPSPRPSGAGAGGAASAAVELELMRRYTSLLGDAITPAEQLKLKILELAAAQEKGGVSDSMRARALSAFQLSLDAAAVATRERLGIASQEEITTIRLRELESQRAKGFVKNAEEMAAAERIIAREAKAASEALQVRGAIFPGLKQFELDAQNLQKNLDNLATTSLGNLGTALTDLATGTTSASQAFRNLALQVTRSIIEMTIRMLILAPIARGLQATLGGFPLPGGAPIGQGGIGHNASGTDNWRGGPTWVGEQGPELLNLPRGSQIIPNSVARGGAGGAIQINSTYQIAGAVGKEELAMAIRQSHDRAVQQAVSIANAGAPARQMRYRQLGT